jgi:hypothetical protein
MEEEPRAISEPLASQPFGELGRWVGRVTEEVGREARGAVKAF